MLRKASEAVHEGNDPVPQQEELGPSQPKMEDVYRMMKEALDRWDKKLNEISDEMGKLSDVMNKHETRLEHGARQPRLATEADGQEEDTIVGLASARRTPQQQHRQCLGIAFLHAGLNSAQLPTRLVSA